MPVPGPGSLWSPGQIRSWRSNAPATGAPAAPGAPTGVSGVAGNASAVVSWTAPASNGGSAIIDYFVEQSVSPFTTWAASSGGSVSTATSQTVTGLTNGVGYQFRVYAQNANGYGAASTPNSATVTPTAASSSNPSGFSPPSAASVTNGVGDTFTLKYIEDFKRTVVSTPDYTTVNNASSPFDNEYGTNPGNDLPGGVPITISTYPYYSTTGTWDDTSNRGHYDPAILSVAAGSSILRKHIRYVNPWPRVSAILPRLGSLFGSPYSGSTRDVWGGRFEMAWRCPLPLNTYKIAWLLWPLSNTRQTPTGVDADGEIDYPEGDLFGNANFTCFQHWQGQVTGTPTEQTQVVPKLNGANVPTVGAWYKTAFEWVPGIYKPPVSGTASASDPPRSTGGYVKVYLNDVLQGTAANNVPMAPMHWGIQSETHLGSAAIDLTADGYIEIDWIAFSKWEPGSRTWVDPD